MESFRLEEMVKGWFIGDFEPAVRTSTDFEVAVKHYVAGQAEEEHYHAVATEVTVVVSGSVEMCGDIHSAGSILVMKPGEPTAFRAVTDAITAVVKYPSVRGDKYLVADADG